MKRKLTEEQSAAIELERLAWVIRVEPGSLERIEGIGLSYEGPPEWLEREIRDAHGWDAEVFTVVTDGGGYMSAPEETLTLKDGRTARLYGTYNHSGETECPVPMESGELVTRKSAVLVADPFRHGWRNPRRELAVRAECPMCEARIGKEHEYVGVGEGYEAVYVVDAVEESEDAE